MTAPAIRVYSRPGCHLCELFVEELLPLIKGRAALEIVDIDSRPDWQRQYGTRIPVLEIDGQEICELQLDSDAVRAAVMAAG